MSKDLNAAKKPVPSRIYRKEIKRIIISRDNLKEKNREKAKVVKDLKDRLNEVKDSRNNWKEELRKERKLVKEIQSELEIYAQSQNKLQNQIDVLYETVRTIKKKAPYRGKKS